MAREDPPDSNPNFNGAIAVSAVDLLHSLFFDIFREGKSIRFVLSGQSMYPVLREGDVLTVKPITFQEAEFGDVLTCQHRTTQKITVHRVVKVQKDGDSITVWTSAEAGSCFCCDPPLTPHEFHVARVVVAERGARRIDLTSPVYVLLGKIRTFILVRFHVLIRIQRKCLELIDRLFSGNDTTF